MTNNIMFDTIVYHSCCPDGIAGLWCGYKYKKDFNQIKMKAGIDPMFDTTGKKIIFIDVCPSFNFLLVHTKLAESITILDHHKSAFDMYNANKEILDKIDNLNIIFDMEKCGAQIAWDYFFGGVRPWFINYVGDRDLWKWVLPDSKELCSAFDFMELFREDNFDIIDAVSEYDEYEINDLIKVGKTINIYQDKLVIKESNNSMEATFDFNDTKYHVQVGTIGYNLVSQLGNNLTKKGIVDFAVVWNYNIVNDTFNISLRGHNSSPDLSVIAKYFGGGGHAKAAGFIVSTTKFKEIIKFI